MLSYNTGLDKWTKANMDPTTSFLGGIKYPSLCQIGSSNEFMMTGGCSIFTNEAIGKCYKINYGLQLKFTDASSLKYARYGHCSVYVNGYVMAIGGFMMNDSIGSEPVTLDSVEKYHTAENVWSPAADLNITRSYAGV